MAKKLLFERFGHTQLCSELRELLAECLAQDIPRYQRVEIAADSLAATDGRRLVVVKIPHHLEAGLYFITADGFLLRDESQGYAFLKYTDIMLTGKNKKSVTTQSCHGCRYEAIQITGILLAKLGATAVFSVELFSKPVELICKLSDKVTAYIGSRKNGPCMICGAADNISITYWQIPLQVDDE